MRVVITNTALENRAGTELYVRDLAYGLKQRGHTALVYSERLGGLAEELRAMGIEVVDDLTTLASPPDLIHGHHHLSTMTALLAFPRTPAIFVCHGPEIWQEEPPLFPRIKYYVAVDRACEQRILQKGIDAAQVRLIHNFVDLHRFKQRPPLPDNPRRALIFSNQACTATHEPAVRGACRRAGISVDIVGSAAHRVSEAPESILGGYDLVFAKAKAAWEALAVGAAVILCDAAGVGPMVTTRNLDELRAFNFGVRCLNQPLHPFAITQQLAQYDSRDAADVCRHIRAGADVNLAVDALIQLYEKTLAEHRLSPAGEPAEEEMFVARYLRDLDKAVCAFERDAVRFQSVQHSRSWTLFSKYVSFKQRVLPSIGKSGS
ncbi:MAG TPA: glycosyltransferase family 4 protein [Pyrinomonadaceae bacterium]|nr:glycosyltransferase family 4 protein [Pyrinomonadaceae bacterium]